MEHDIYTHQFKITPRATTNDVENIEPFVVQTPVLIVGFDPITMILYYRKIAPQAGCMEAKPKQSK